MFQFMLLSIIWIYQERFYWGYYEIFIRSFKRKQLLMKQKGIAILEGAANSLNHYSEPSLYSMDIIDSLSVNKMSIGEKENKEFFIEEALHLKFRERQSNNSQS